MTISRPSRTGGLEKLQSRGRVTVELPNVPYDSGAPWRAASSAFAGISASLGEIADRAAARQGEALGRQAALGAALPSYAPKTAATPDGPVKVGAVPSDVDAAIVAGAEMHGVDPAAMRTIAWLESKFKPGAKNPDSSAGGLFQFVNDTAQAYGLKNRFDAYASAEAAARLAKDNSAAFQKRFGRAPNTGELYLMHQQGAGGALALLANTSRPAVDVLTDVYKGNRARAEQAVRLNGGGLNMTAGEFAGKWLAKAGGAAPAAPSAAPPAPAKDSPFNAPLDLGRPGTILGDAARRSYNATYGWRLDAEIRENIGTIYDQHKDDPPALDAALGAYQDEVLGSPGLQDGDLREAAMQRFTQLGSAYRRDAATRAAGREAAATKLAYGEILDAAELDLEKRAYLSAQDADGEAAVLQDFDRYDLTLQDAVAAGTLTAAEARARSDRMRSGFVEKQARGRFDALTTPEEKEAFADGLMDAYLEGEGPIGELSFDEARGLVETLRREAQQGARQLSAEEKMARRDMQRLIADDVASIATTGQPLLRNGSELLFADVERAVGPEAALEWQQGRERAKVVWGETADMAAMTAAEINQRLAELRPEPGTEGYAENFATWQEIAGAAERVKKLRESDPARAADEAFPQLAAAREAFNPSAPETVEALAAGRLAAQEELGIARGDWRIFTANEAKAISDAMRQDPPAAVGFALALQAGLGEDAGLALDQVADNAPSLAEAARIVAEGGSSDALEHLARLQVMEKQDGWKPPKVDAKAARAATVQTYGRAFATDPARQQALEETARRVFISMAIDAGVEPDPSSESGRVLYEKALQVAAGARYSAGVRFGGIDEVNGHKVRVPVDMRSGALQEALDGVSDEDLGALPPMISENGLEIRARQLAGAELIPVDKGRYLVALPNRYGGSPKLIAGEPDAETSYFDEATGRWLWTFDPRTLAQGQAVRAPAASGAFEGVVAP